MTLDFVVRLYVPKRLFKDIKEIKEMQHVGSRKTGWFGESDDRIKSVKADIQYINVKHCRALRDLKWSPGYSWVLKSGETVIKNGKHDEITRLLEEAPACLFGVSFSHDRDTDQHIWWHVDDLIDHLLAAKEIARWSPKCAAMMTGVDENLIAELALGGATKARDIARNAKVFVRWRAKDIRRTMGILSLSGDLKATRHANARLLMACSVLRMNSRPLMPVFTGLSRNPNPVHSLDE